jgi:phosphatidylserine decarboxylase
MERLEALIILFVIGVGLFCTALFFWRYIWFSRNPRRFPPDGDNILSPADGKVVYVRRVHPQKPVLSTKGNKSILLSDLLREDLDGEKLLIGVFMSPFNVHINRTPLGGNVEYVKHHPPIHRNHNMTSMHWRTLAGVLPFYENSPHLITNERTVTLIKGSFHGRPVSCYINQIAGGSIRGIESFVKQGSAVGKGDVLGRIKIGSQVDTVITWNSAMNVRVRPGMRVRAGETIFVEYNRQNSDPQERWNE